MIDMTGQRYGRLVVLERSKRSEDKRTRWVCRCDCGTVKSILGYNLKHKDHARRIYSCGCQGRENRAKSNVSHGQSASKEMKLFWEAKKRAKKAGKHFDISPSDVVIPSHCPLLEIPLDSRDRDHWPSIDRLYNDEGYTRANIWVISMKANRIKSNATLEDFVRIARNWSKQCDT